MLCFVDLLNTIGNPRMTPLLPSEYGIGRVVTIAVEYPFGIFCLSFNGLKILNKYTVFYMVEQYYIFIVLTIENTGKLFVLTDCVVILTEFQNIEKTATQL